MAQTQILMLQPDAFCEHTIQQNTSADGAPTQTRCAVYGDGERGNGGEGEGKERRGGQKGKGGLEVKLEQGRRLAEASPGYR